MTGSPKVEGPKGTPDGFGPQPLGESGNKILAEQLKTVVPPALESGEITTDDAVKILDSAPEGVVEELAKGQRAPIQLEKEGQDAA